ncbi:ester cyclase [Halomonas beimenensis]|uniref:ester cyclase n=1 Tax=Halomonas beimenensis TaxID=475662 RepID=UPI00361923BE
MHTYTFRAKLTLPQRDQARPRPGTPSRRLSAGEDERPGQAREQQQGQWIVNGNTTSKASLHALLHGLAEGREPAHAYHPDARWQGMHPIGTLEGVGAISRFWRALRGAFPDMERRDLIFVGGDNHDDPRKPGWRAPHLVAALGHYQATFAADYLGIPATGGVVHLRYAEAHWLDGGKIRHSRVMIDLLDLMRQAGVWPLPPSLGTEGTWPGPASLDGVRLTDEPPRPGASALETIFAMHRALLSFDGKSLDSMPHGQYWTDNFMYYAAAGIGMTRGLQGFRAHHQIPFLKAFPDRIAEGHFIRISDGDYAVTGGNVMGTHRDTYMGMPATGRRISVPVMDFYRLDGDRIAENWLPMDVLGMAAQMGNDLLARLRHLTGHPVTSL